MFDKKEYLKQAKTISLIALFVFLLATINLMAKTNDQVTSAASMEMSGYVSLYDDRYDDAGDARTDELKQIAADLETDTASYFQRQFFILDKGTGQVISGSDVSEAVRNELNVQVNERTIIIDGQSCKVVDFNHYKLLVKVNTLAEYNQFIDAIMGYVPVALATLLAALALTAAAQKLAGNRRSLRTGCAIVITLLVVGAFAFEAIQAELNQLSTIVSAEQSTIQQDLEHICNESSIAQQVTKENVEEIGNSLAKTSTTLKGVTFIGPESHLGGTSQENRLIASEDLQIAQDESRIKNERIGFYIQAALLMLLAFILANEARKRDKAALQAKAAGAACLTDDDRRFRTIALLVGMATSTFGIINVLRLRQVVMMNWTDNISAIIGTIFTATLLASIFGSLASSTILKHCGSVKSYAVAVCGLGVAGAVVCGISNNIVVFVLGLLVYNVAHTTTRMCGDFYTTTIDDKGRKDRCYIELDSGKAVGEVIGTIAGGIVSVVISYAFAQLAVGVIFLFTAIYALRLRGEGFATGSSAANEGSIGESLRSFAAAAKHPTVFLYMICIAMMGSVAFMLVQYKLPLDIAALGYSAVVLSFVKTMQDVVDIFSRPLFGVVNKRLGPMLHAVAFIVLNGAVIMVYMLAGGSLLVIGVSVALLGLLDGAASYAVIQAFRELPDLQKMAESDRLVALKLSQKVGDTVSPPLFSAFQSGPVVPALFIALPLLYLLYDKRARSRRA